jgi:peptidoglycan hydrolase-like protein with peptidoglycan-binding domain
MAENVYDSLLDVPLDEQDPANDGDDRLVPSEGPYAVPSVRTSFPLEGVTSSTAIAVPFIASQPGSRGKHVRALNRALSKAGFRRWQVFSTIWPRQIPGRINWVTRAVKKFQASRGLPITGKYDRATHEKLARFYDAYAIKYLLIAPIPKPTKDELERAAFAGELMYLYNNRFAYSYTQARPFDCRRPPSRGLDCSASGEWAGAHSPIGSLSGYPSCGYGNTDTQISRYRRLGRARATIRDAKPGDPKYYGSGGDPSHVAYYIGHKDGRARVWSFGSYPIKILDADYRHDGIATYNLTGR